MNLDTFFAEFRSGTVYDSSYVLELARYARSLEEEQAEIIKQIRQERDNLRKVGNTQLAVSAIQFALDLLSPSPSNQAERVLLKAFEGCVSEKLTKQIVEVLDNAKLLKEKE